MVPRSALRTAARFGGLVVALVLVSGLGLAAAPTQTGQAAGVSVYVGAAGSAPPSELGPYTMTPFPDDLRDVGHSVADVPGPAGTSLHLWPNLFDKDPDHPSWRVGHYVFDSTYFPGDVWARDYTGDVYTMISYGLAGCPDHLVMALPPNTYAFYFYALPSWGSATMTATVAGASSGDVSMSATGGAPCVGFYSTAAPITTITIDVTVPTGQTVCQWSVGEFGIYMGSPASGEEASAPSCVRADVAAVIYGGWDGISVKAYVGGTEQQALYTARDGFGEAAVLWTFYPPETGWTVSVGPHLPAGLDATRWRYKLVRIVADGSDVEDPDAASARIYSCSERVFYFQLIDTGALPGE